MSLFLTWHAHYSQASQNRGGGNGVGSWGKKIEEKMGDKWSLLLES
jgi:hypothetical protein